jgi:translation initiation factor IF-3
MTSQFTITQFSTAKPAGRVVDRDSIAVNVAKRVGKMNKNATDVSGRPRISGRPTERCINPKS